MTHVVCIAAVAPLRAAASHKAEMVSQLLFGEYARVLETEKDFTLVKSLYDGYEGWCQSSQLAETDEAAAARQPAGFVQTHAAVALLKEEPVYLPLGAPVYGASPAVYLGRYQVHYQVAPAPVLPFHAAAVQRLSRLFLQTPYLWGGRSAFGIDCSGFSQQVYKMMGLALLRDASQQATQGELVGFLEETQCGDLAFFDNEEGRITHVGILLSSEEVIHASGRVRIDKIDHQGIFNTDLGQRTHRLRLIRRLYTLANS